MSFDKLTILAERTACDRHRLGMFLTRTQIPITTIKSIDFGNRFAYNPQPGTQSFSFKIQSSRSRLSIPPTPIATQVRSTIWNVLLRVMRWHI